MHGITAQVSLSPLGEDDLSPAIDAAIGELDRHGLERETGYPGTMAGIDPVREGSGEGCFAVVRADK